jgi:hypothetical protein
VPDNLDDGGAEVSVNGQPWGCALMLLALAVLVLAFKATSIAEALAGVCS